ncbi:hypothetical protein [Halalkalibacter nanhaiisediminis]|uniref:Flagellar hook-length control protein FliK n=1 Tax=Halalkalibacter nanhaiisediminis TaxID=688079 RepID=A0A562QMB0_9BACI|nr:hypothetical protein [Halalkalibacter nanhaiisediminis]TWI57874.1 hypothetical protein IQ10_01203 [Halalkalibacter nanhaiisediminis]
MQIQHQVHTAAQQPERAAQLREGDVYRATIKERKGNDEAVLSIRGREVVAKFEGGIPASDRATIQVTEPQGDVIRVKTLHADGQQPRTNEQGSTGRQQELNQTLRQLGVQQPTPELRQAASILMDKGIPLTKEAVQELQRFMNEGKPEERLQTVQAIANKRLEVTANHLRAVHEALHGRPLNQVMTDLAREMDPEFKPQPVEREGVERDANRSREVMPQSAREHIDTLMRQNGAFSSGTIEQVERTMRQPEQLHQLAREQLSGSLSTLSTSVQGNQAQLQQTLSLLEVVNHAEKTLQREPSLEKVLQQIQSQLSGHQELTEAIETDLNKVMESARDFQEKGRELKARQELSTMIQQIKEVAKTSEMQSLTVEANTYVQNEQFQTSVEMTSKSIAVTTVTEKLAQMTADFKSLQRDITRNLDLVNRQIEQFRSQAQHHSKPLLETTIKKLDNAILRSEMMLLADMRTERQLMQASSQLHEAKKLLGKGRHQEANRIVREVQQLVEQLNFKPSETKIMHYTAANERALREAQLPSQSFTSQLNETARGPVQEGSPRAMFEMVRGLGLNRDSEVAQQLASGRDQQQQDSSQRDLKTTLLQLARGEEEGSRVQQLASQALNNVTGQQLLSRSDQQGNLQSMFFQLPFLLEKKVENLQVFVNSRNEGQQVDWENCSLYFLMETPKMGEIGIVVSATERQLSVTLKNDKADFQAKMEPLVEMAVEKLGEIGYSINGIKYTHLSSETEKTEQETEKSRQQPVFTEKGFDFKI